MEVLEEQAGLLTNHEVLELVRKHHQLRARRTRGRKKSGWRALPNQVEVEDGVFVFLKDKPAMVQSASAISACITALQPFHLTRTEVLQLLNHRPSTLVEVHLIVEECEERLSEAQCQDILDVLAEQLPAPPRPQEKIDQEPLNPPVVEGMMTNETVAPEHHQPEHHQQQPQQQQQQQQQQQEGDEEEEEDVLVDDTHRHDHEDSE